MARIRSVKPSLRTSQVAAAWPREVRYFWVLLWGYLDDSGRGLDVPKAIAGDCFPLDEDMTPAKVNRWLGLIATAKSPDRDAPLCRYEVASRRYIHSVYWSEHQRPNRPSPSLLPPCPIHESLTESFSERRTESAPVDNRVETAPTAAKKEPSTSPKSPKSSETGAVVATQRMERTGHHEPSAQATAPPLTEPALSRHVLEFDSRNLTEGEGDSLTAGPPPATTAPSTVNSPPPRRCPDHTDDPDPPACRRCADARRARADWDQAQLTVGNPGPGRDSRPVPLAAQCPRHRGQLADNCSACRSERLAVDEP